MPLSHSPDGEWLNASTDFTWRKNDPYWIIDTCVPCCMMAV
jgi:hypothetical protein